MESIEMDSRSRSEAIIVEMVADEKEKDGDEKECLKIESTNQELKRKKDLRVYWFKRHLIVVLSILMQIIACFGCVHSLYYGIVLLQKSDNFGLLLLFFSFVDACGVFCIRNLTEDEERKLATVLFFTYGFLRIRSWVDTVVYGLPSKCHCQIKDCKVNYIEDINEYESEADSEESETDSNESENTNEEFDQEDELFRMGVYI